MSNPETALQSMLAQKNPALSKAMDYVKENGGDAKAAFQKLAKDSGIDPAEIERMI